MLSSVADGVPEGEEGWEDKKCVNQDRKGYPPYGGDIGMSVVLLEIHGLWFSYSCYFPLGMKEFPSLEEGSRGWDLVLKAAYGV